MHRGQPSYVYTHTDKDTVIDKAIYDTHLETTVLTFQTPKLLRVGEGARRGLQISSIISFYY